MIRYICQGPRDYKNDPVPVVTRPNWEIYICSHGKIAPQFKDHKSYPTKASHAWIMPKDSYFGWRGEGVANRHVLHLTSIPEVLQLVLNQKSYISVDLNDLELSRAKEHFEQLQQHQEKGNYLSSLYIQKVVTELLLMILEKVDPLEGFSAGRIDEVRIRDASDWYREHMHRAPSMDEIAIKIHISSGYFRRILLKHRGQKPHDYFLDMRMSRAKKLLHETSLSTLDIAEKCGFSCASSFCRAFKRYTSLTPHQWQKTLVQY
jgi:AraC-like DNA-binding protein